MEVEWVKEKTMKWFGHMETAEPRCGKKKIYLSDINGPNRRGRPLECLKDWVKGLYEC